MAKKAKRATRRAHRTSNAKLKKAQQQLKADFLAECSSPLAPPVPPLLYSTWEVDCAKSRAAEEARAADALTMMRGMLKQVPDGKDGLIQMGFSVAQARALVAVLGRII